MVLEHDTDNVEVTGSIPVGTTFKQTMVLENIEYTNKEYRDISSLVYGSVPVDREWAINGRAWSDRVTTLLFLGAFFLAPTFIHITDQENDVDC